jgi:RNA polymerase sigma factor (sigma-70 family)
MSMLCTQSDARLVDLVRAGHASAFEAIVQRYRKPLLGYCSRLLPASRAEDAVQQTFLKAYQSMVSGDAELNLRPWLYRIAHNASLNLLRQNGWSHEQLDENMDGVQRPDQAVELRERLRTTVAAVKALPERQRDAVLLREIDGLSYDQIALALGVGDGAVRQLLHRARATLRAGLTAVAPVGLVERLAAAFASTGGDPSARVAEWTAGVGLGTGAAKIGAAVLATGVIATGAATMPLSHQSRHGGSGGIAAADAAAVDSPGGAPAAIGPTTRVDDRSGSGSGAGDKRGSRRGRRHGHPGGSGSGDRHSGPSGDERHSGSGTGSGSGEQRSGSGDRSGSGEDGGHRSGSRQSGDRSGGTSDGSGGERQSGSDDGAATITDDGGQLSCDGGGDGGHDGGGGDTTTVPTAPTGPVSEDFSTSGESSGGSGGSTSGD